MAKAEPSASQLIDQMIAGVKDWRGGVLARLRQIVHEADPEIVEEWKWGTAVWSHNGMVCSAGTFKDHVKLNFFKGASLPDPKGLFNAGLEAKAARAIDFNEGDKIDEPGLNALIRAAVAANGGGAAKAPTAKAPPPVGGLPKISQPANRALAGAGIKRIEQLAKWTEAEVLALHGVGPTAMPPLRAALKAKGLSFAAGKKKKGK
jgi:hypothetical protein